MMILKACTRCGGDLVRDEWDGPVKTVSCLQCGAGFRLRPLSEKRQPASARTAYSQLKVAS
jgi:hypothetical protein